jgi:hypothetical protein
MTPIVSYFTALVVILKAITNGGVTMSESKSHKDTANRIAKKLGAEYNSNKGPDIVTPKIAVEVGQKDSLKDNIRQLQGFQKPVYIAAPNKETLDKTLELTQDLTVGVMDKTGKVIKKSTRG